MSVILTTTLFYKALILQREIGCWSLLGLKGDMSRYLLILWKVEISLETPSYNSFHPLHLYVVYILSCILCTQGLVKESFYRLSILLLIKDVNWCVQDSNNLYIIISYTLLTMLVGKLGNSTRRWIQCVEKSNKKYYRHNLRERKTYKVYETSWLLYCCRCCCNTYIYIYIYIYIYRYIYIYIYR